MIVLKQSFHEVDPKQSLGEKWSMTSKRLRSTDLRCSLLSSFEFNALGSSLHLRGPVLLAASLLLLGSQNFQHSDFFFFEALQRLYLLHLICWPFRPSPTNATPLHHPRIQTSCLPSTHFGTPLSLSTLSTLLCSGCFVSLPAPSLSPNSLGVLQWNVKNLQIRSAELL